MSFRILRPGIKPRVTNPLAQGLVAAYSPRIQGMGGDTLIDFSGERHNGSLDADAYLVASTRGPVVALDGTDDKVDCGVVRQNWDSTVTGVTFGGWVWIDSAALGVNQEWVRQRRGSSTNFFSLNKATNSLRVIVYTTDTQQVMSRYNWFIGRYDQWHHIMGVWDGTTVYCYADGELIGTEGLGGSFDNAFTERNLWLGSLLDGQLGEMLLYTRALSPSEIRQLYADPYAWARPIHQASLGAILSGGGAAAGGNIGSINGVDWANIGSINGVNAADIGSINGIDAN